MNTVATANKSMKGAFGAASARAVRYPLPLYLNLLPHTGSQRACIGLGGTKVI
jgi:hypothetical protein